MIQARGRWHGRSTFDQSMSHFVSSLLIRLSGIVQTNIYSTLHIVIHDVS